MRVQCDADIRGDGVRCRNLSSWHVRGTEYVVGLEARGEPHRLCGTHYRAVSRGSGIWVFTDGIGNRWCPTGSLRLSYYEEPQNAQAAKPEGQQ